MGTHRNLSAAALVIAALLTPSLTVTHAQESNKDRINRQVALIAARTAAAQAVQEIENAKQSNADTTVRLSAEMSAKIADHRTVEQSKPAARGFVAESAERSFRERIRTICQKNGLAEADLRKAMPDLDASFTKALDRHLAGVFADQYQAARRVAVAKQREGIDVRIPLPKQAEIDAKLGQWDRHRTGLIDSLVRDAIPAGIVLFAENHDHTRSLATKIVDQIDLEYRNQLKVVDEWSSDSTVPKRNLTSKSIESLIAAKLQQHVAKSDRQGVPSYGLFQTVTNAAVEKARELEAKRLDAYISQAAVSVKPEAVGVMIKADPAAHRTLAASREKLADQMLEPALNEIVRNYVRSSDGESRQQLENYFDRLVREDNRRRMVAQRLTQKLDVLLPSVRKPIAQAQKAQHFRTLEAWKPTEEQNIQGDSDPSGGPANYSAALALLGMSQPPQTTLLQETEELVVADVRQRLALGVQALRRQRAIVEEMEKTHARKLEQDVRSGRAKGELIAEWQTEFKSRWGKETASSQFPIFKQTTGNIEKAVSKHYDDIKKRADDERIAAAPRGSNSSQTGANKKVKSRETESVQEHREVASQNTAAGGVSGTIPGGAPVGTFPGGNSGPGSGGGPGGDGTGDGSDEKKDGKDGEGDRAAGDGKADMLLVLQDATKGMCTATLERGGSLRVQFQPAAIKPTVTDIAAGVTPLLQSLLAAKAAETPKANGKTSELVLRFHLKVRSEAVRHLLGIELRQNLENTVAQWNSKQSPGARAIRFAWSDGN